jgi:hypothetical protein
MTKPVAREILRIRERSRRHRSCAFQGRNGVGRTRDDIRLPSAVFRSRRYSVLVGAYNMKLVPVADVPKRYSDLLDSMWRGKLGSRPTTPIGLRSSSRRSESVWEFDLFRASLHATGVSMREGQAVLAARDHVATIAGMADCPPI